MAWGRRRQQRDAAEDAQLADITGGDWLAIVGESNYAPAIDSQFGANAAVGDLTLPTWAILTAEPSNPYDPNAVRAMLGGQTVGYLARENAERLGAFFRAYDGAYCPALVRGPAGRRGIVLRVSYAILEGDEPVEVTASSALNWR